MTEWHPHQPALVVPASESGDGHSQDPQPSSSLGMDSQAALSTTLQSSLFIFLAPIALSVSVGVEKGQVIVQFHDCRGPGNSPDGLALLLQHIQHMLHLFSHLPHHEAKVVPHIGCGLDRKPYRMNPG